MGSLERVPCIHVDKNNIETMWPTITSSIKHCHWIGLDLELSGIGNKNNFGLKEVDERYAAFKEVSKTRGIVAIGLSTFQFLPMANKRLLKTRKTEDEILNSNDIEGWSDCEDSEAEEDLSWPFVSNSFNILSRCTDETVLEGDAKSFLENHSFDFERQEKFGIEYNRTHAVEVSKDELETPSLKNLLYRIILSRKPVVFHNGFIDLMFLYQNLYLDLPSKMETFLCNCHDIFISGIYDTKYITEHELKFESTFLEYVYYFQQRNNVDNMMAERRHLWLTFPDYSYSISPDLKPGIDVEYRNMKTKIMERRPENIEVCKHYGYHGWCPDAADCKKSHNIDLFLDQKRVKSMKKKKQKLTSHQKSQLLTLSNFNEALVIADSNGTEVTDDTVEENFLQSLGKVKSGAHQSGYDAFMTGYVFGTIVYGVCFSPPFDQPLSAKTLGLKEIVNKLFLSGKTYPLRVGKSQYDKPSKDCQHKLTSLREKSKLASPSKNQKTQM